MRVQRGRRIGRSALFVVALAVLAAALTASAAAAAPADAATVQSDEASDETVAVDELDGDRFWAGQEIVLTGFDDGETVEFDHDDATRERTASDGTVAIDTSTYETGEWRVNPGAFGSGPTFVVNEQTLDVTVDDEHAVEATGLSIESNRVGFVVTYASDDVDAATLSSAIDGAVVDDEGRVVADGSADPAVDVSALPGGEYEIEVEARDSTASDTATITVSAGIEVEGNHPLPPEGTDLLYDVNGDRAVTNGDVTDLFGFQHYHPAVENHSEKFDFDGTGDVGQGDVVELFYVVNGDSQIKEPTTRSVHNLDGGAGDRFWIGQEVTITGFEAGTTVAFTTEDGANFQERTADDDGKVRIDTSNWATGTWDVESSGDASGAFGVSEQTLGDFSFADDTTSGSTSLQVDSNRATYDLSLSSSELDAAALEQVFDVSGTDGLESRPDEGDLVLHVDDGSRTLEADFSDVDARTYAIEGNVLDSTASAEAEVDVAESDDSDSEFVNGPYSTVAQSEARIPVDVTETDEAWVTIQHTDIDGVGTIHLENVAEDAESVVVGIDTYNLSQDLPAEAVFDVDGAELGPESEETDTFADVTPNRWTGGFSFVLRSFTGSPAENRADDRSRLSLTERTDATFDESSYDVAAGDVATVDVDTVNVDEAWVTVEHVDLDGQAIVHLENLPEEPEDTVTVGIDTQQLSQGAAPSEVFGALGAEIGPETEETGEFADVGDNRWSEGHSLQLRAFTEDPAQHEATDRGRLTIGEPTASEPDAQFEAGPYAVIEDETATIDVDLSDTDEGYVTLNHEDYDGGAVVHVENAYHNEEPVTVEVDTGQLSTGSDPANVFSVQNAELGPETAETGEFADTSSEGPFGTSNEWSAGTSFAIRAYTDDPDEQNATDRSRLTLTHRPVGDLTTWIAPGDTNLEDLNALLEGATQSNEVAAGDVVIAQVEDPVQSDYVGENASAFDAADQDLGFYFEDQHAFGTESHDVSEVADDVRVLTDAENDQFFLAFEAGTIGERSNGWDLVFEVGPENDHRDDDSDEPITTSSTYEVRERTLAITGEGQLGTEDRLLVDATADSEIVAETNVAPNTEGDIYVETQQATYSEDLTVDQDGEMVATFDFSDNEEGEIVDTIEFTEFGGDEYDSVEGVFEEPEPSSFVAYGAAPDQVEVDEAATLDATVENDGGSTDDAEISVTIDGHEVVSESVELGAGSTWEDSFDIPTDEAGTVDWEISTQHSSESGTVEVNSGD